MTNNIKISQYQWEWLAPKLNNGDTLQFAVTNDNIVYAIINNGSKEKIIKLPRKIIPFPAPKRNKTLREKLFDMLQKVIEEF